MKLIKMTDFVLEEGNPSNTDSQFADKVMAYANFLKQPLELKMFVSNDKEDILFDGFENTYDNINKKNIFNDKLGLEIRFHYNDIIIFSVRNNLPAISVKTIEDLIPYKLETTKEF